MLKVDAVVVGAGLGGIYAIHKLREIGLDVLGLERLSGVGGVWRHNAYPGSRVDIESFIYSYHFSPEIYREWKWSERYCAQPELLRYLEYVADKLKVTEHFRFNTPMTGAQWRPQEGRYHIQAGDDLEISARFLVMATGNLSYPRDVPFAGADRFKGDLAISSRWPDREITFEGKRVAVVGTGSSGVQCATALAGVASHLYVFQRAAHYASPCRNGPPNLENIAAVAADPLMQRALIWNSSRQKPEEPLQPGEKPRVAVRGYPSLPPRKAADCSPEEVQERLEKYWEMGGHGLPVAFTDSWSNPEANKLIADFVRGKIRQIVKDPVVAEKLMPKYPIGIKRLSIIDGYYEIFNRPDVALVDTLEDPIQEITELGIKTRDREYEVDVIILALGFKSFTGELVNANIRNAEGQPYTARWGRGPRSLLGLMTSGFPNLFVLTGPGSPGTQANLFIQNEYHVEWVANLLKYMADHGHQTIEPSVEAEDRWTEYVHDLAVKIVPLKVNYNNYLVHVNPDGTRAFMCHMRLDQYVETANEVAANGYVGFVFDGAPAMADKKQALPA